MHGSFEGGFGEVPTRTKLVDFFGEQFGQALADDFEDEEKGRRHESGVKVKRVVLPIAHEVERHSLMMTLKPPHPRDASGEYVQVFFPLPDAVGVTSPVTGGLSELIEFTGPFFVRKFKEGNQPVGFWMVDTNGVYDMDLDSSQEGLKADEFTAAQQKLMREENLWDFVSICSPVSSIE